MLGADVAWHGRGGHGGVRRLFASRARDRPSLASASTSRSLCHKRPLLTSSHHQENAAKLADFVAAFDNEPALRTLRAEVVAFASRFAMPGSLALQAACLAAHK